MPFAPARSILVVRVYSSASQLYILPCSGGASCAKVFGGGADRSERDGRSHKMTVAALSNSTETQAAAQPTPASSKSPASQPEAAGTDTVTLASTTQAAQKEASETPAQTAAEAAKGDPQAQRLLSKEAAARAAYEFSSKLN